MDIKLFSLCNQDSQEAEKGKEYILDCVKDYFPECGDFNEFTSQKRMLVAISQSLLAADIVLVAVQSTMYNATKRLLSSALDIPTKANEEVSAVLSGRPKAKQLKPNLYTAAVTFPETSVILPTSDYLNCGFAITSGGQHIIYMPVEEEKAQQIVLGSLYDYFAELSEPYTVSNALKNRHRKLIDKAVKKLNDESTRVAVVGNDSADYLVSFLSKDDISVFTIDINYEFPDVDNDVRELAVTFARNVREANRTEIGVYISDPFVTNDESEAVCAYIAIANSEGIKTYKMFMEDGETTKDLLKACADKLLLILSGCEQMGDNDEESEDERKADKDFKGILGIIASAAVLAASIAGFVTALILR